MKEMTSEWKETQEKHPYLVSIIIGISAIVGFLAGIAIGLSSLSH